jgi:hypothetical protein
MFEYSSNIFEANFDLMDSMPACGTSYFIFHITLTLEEILITYV